MSYVVSVYNQASVEAILVDKRDAVLEAFQQLKFTL